LGRVHLLWVVAVVVAIAGCSRRPSARHDLVDDPVHEAEAGDPDAQFEAGVRLADAPGGAADYGQAAAWFRRAADHGHAGAQSALGVMYLRGQGVSRSRIEAIKWLTLAAGQDSPERKAYALWRAYAARQTSRAEIAEGEQLARLWTKAP
jgi:TPR repeat protein